MLWETEQKTAAGRRIIPMNDKIREIRRICRSIGIAPFSMHAFRAAFATRAIESGMNPKTLQEILGHSNYNITKLNNPLFRLQE